MARRRPQGPYLVGSEAAGEEKDVLVASGVLDGESVVSALIALSSVVSGLAG